MKLNGVWEIRFGRTHCLMAFPCYWFHWLQSTCWLSRNAGSSLLEHSDMLCVNLCEFPGCIVSNYSHHRKLNRWHTIFLQTQESLLLSESSTELFYTTNYYSAFHYFTQPISIQYSSVPHNLSVFTILLSCTTSQHSILHCPTQLANIWYTTVLHKKTAFFVTVQS